MPLCELAESGPEDVRTEAGGRGDRALVVHCADGAHGGRASERVPAVGHARRVGALGERLEDRVAHKHATEWHVPGVDALREHQQVRAHALVVDGEPGSGATEADQHLVGDVHDVVAAAQIAHLAQVAGWWDDHARAADHRFQDQSGDRRRSLEQDHLLEMFERPLALFLGGLEPNTERYRKGPKKRTAPAAPVSLAQRRGSPVRWIEVVVEPW